MENTIKEDHMKRLIILHPLSTKTWLKKRKTSINDCLTYGVLTKKLNYCDDKV